MATDLLLMPESPELLALSQKLGFTKTFFLEKDFVLLASSNKKELLAKIQEAKKKKMLVILQPKNEDLLRFALEKTSAEMIIGQELLNKEDSLHFPRGGLDQVTCKIAAVKGKIIGFSFREILEAEGSERSKLMGRMLFNLKLCRKYKLKVFFGNFSNNIWEMRSFHDLKAFFEILGGKGKEGFEF